MELEVSLPKTSLTRKLLYGAVIIFIITLVWFGSLIKTKFRPEKPVHYHAGFVVVKNNQLVSFADPKYMDIEPCTISDANQAPETATNRQIQKAHLHDNVGDVVHVEQADAKWQDLFTNIKYDLDYSHAEGYLNGQKITNFFSLPIKDDDSLVVFVGDGNNISEFLPQAVAVEHIRQVAAKSEDCK